MKSAILSNQKLINEIDAVRDNFIQSRPHMAMSVFKSTRKHGDRRTNKYDNIVDRPIFKDDRGAGSPAFQSHPLGYQPPGGNTLHPDPLFSGVVDRPVPKGGAMLKRNMPLTRDDSSDDEGAGYLNGYSSSDDEDDYDDGAGLVDDVKETYHKTKEYVKGKIPSKAQISKVSNEVYKMITSDEAKELGVGALKVAVAALIMSRLGAYGAPVSAAASSAIDNLYKGTRNYHPTEEQRRTAIKARPTGKQLSTTRDTDDDTESLMRARGLKSALHRGRGVKGVSPLAKKKPAPIVGHKRGERVRGDVVAEVMRKHGLSLGQASKYVKEHNLY